MLSQEVTALEKALTTIQTNLEAKWKALVIHSSDIIMIVNRLGEIEFINQPVPSIDTQKPIQQTVYDFLSGDEKDNLRSLLETAFQTGESITGKIQGLAFVKQSATYFVKINPIKNKNKFDTVMVVATDASNYTEGTDQSELIVDEHIKALRKENEKLKQEVKRLIQVQRLAHVGSWEIDYRTDKVWWSAELYKIFNVDPNEFVPSVDNFYQCVYPEDIAIIEKHKKATLENDAPYQFEYRIVLPNGEIRFQRVHGSLERDYKGNPLWLRGTAQDITEQRQVEQILRDSEKRYRELTNLIPVGVFHADMTGRNTYTNRAASEIMGLTPLELDGYGWKKNLHPDDREWVFAEWIKTVEANKPFKFEYRYRHRNGKIVWVLVEAHPELDESGLAKGYVGTLTDISKRREAEEKLRQHQLELAHLSRLQTAGELVSGIAHELNQPLAAIVNYSGGCLARMKKEKVSEPIISAMEKVMSLAEFAGAIIHRLKGFLSKRELQKEWVDANDLVKEAVMLLEMSLAAAKITLHLELADNLPKLCVDKIHIEQVLVVIASNAIEAMSNGLSKLTIQTLNYGNKGVTICIRDTGVGIPEKNRETIFQPFYTTKQNGMGIGLAMVRTIVEAHQGRIWVEDNYIDKCGSQFFVYLPVES